MQNLKKNADTSRYVIVGGAGFIGSHFADILMADDTTEAVSIYDNFSSGHDWHIAHHFNDPRFNVVRADIADTDRLCETLSGHQVVIHLASNPDIAAAVSDPDIDFREGTVLSRNVVEAMRKTNCRRILYASGSGVYGDFGETEVVEDQPAMRPISTYGASKYASEHLISSYCFMFGLSACCFRFGNVVGPRQTHGVGYDFVRKLRDDPSQLGILGDGQQSKSYIHVEDTVAAVLLAHRQCSDDFNVFNVATGDYITVTEIADLAVAALGLDKQDVEYRYSGGDRGWKGDVPVIRLNTDRIKALGWACQNSSTQAIERSLEALLDDLGQQGS
jgi:UDP-glucose 4-epimerase